MTGSNVERIYAGTLRCYNSMETTKRRHFDYMSLLEARQKKFNISPSTSDSALLASLLSDHDREVQAFVDSSDALKQSDPSAHQVLFEYIGRINTALANNAGH